MGGRTGTGSIGEARGDMVAGLGAGLEATSGSAPISRTPSPDQKGERSPVAAALAHPILVLIGLIGVVDCVYTVLWLLGFVGGGVSDRLTGAAAYPGAVIVGLIGLRLRSSRTLDARTRRAWLMISLGIASYGLGYGCLYLAATLHVAALTYPGVVLELATYPIAGGGLALMARPFHASSDLALSWLDVGIVAWSTAMLVWHFAFFPVAREMNAAPSNAFFSAFFPVADLSLVFAMGAVLLRGLRSASQAALAIGAASLLFMFVGDVISGVEELRGTYVQGGLSGVMYSVAWLGLAAGAYLQSLHVPAPIRVHDLTRYRRVFQWLPYVAVAVAFVAPPVYHWNDVEMLEQHVPATGILMALLVARLLVTARQNATLAAAERVRLAAAVEQAAEAIVTTDRNWRITYVNPALTRITGHTAQEIVGQDLSVVRGPSNDDHLAEMRASVDRGEPWHGRFSQQRRDGSIVELDMAVAPLRDDAGGPAGSVVLARDITRERALESQLAQTQRMEAVGRLAGGIAHDFNNILTAISGYSELAIGSLPTDHPASSDIREVIKASDRAAGLTRDLLAFSRRQVMQPRPMDLNEVLESMKSMLERSLGEDIALQVRTQIGLGATVADPSQIEQVILNLAMNARDAMPDGGVLTITTADADLDEAYQRSHVGASAGRFVSMTLADTGTGMAPDVLEHIFEPFFTTKSRGRGTGLGLSTASGIVEQSGGFILAESVPGAGTVFSVFLPRVAAPEPGTDTAAAVQGIPGGNETILVAEDEAPVRRVVERVLRGAGYRVFVAANGHEAMAMAPTLPHLDLLLTDVVMPGMSGVDLARQLTLTRPHLRVVLASGYSGDSLIRVGAGEGTVPYLAKPFTAEALLARVRQVLDEPADRNAVAGL
jgi:PAS domain S-box-containing protein